MNCINCGQAIEKDELGSWIDKSGGDGCLQDNYENDVHKTSKKIK